jgi:membrane protease YdiL (CAAX protease family)
MTVQASDCEAGGRESADQARRYALIALAALVFEEVVSSLLFIFEGCVGSLQGVPTIPIGTVLTHWVLPFLIVYLVERRDARTLGMTIRRERIGAYALYAVTGLILPAVVVGVDRRLLLEFIDQIVYIGVAEEVFFRGYLTGRLCNWLGDLKGLLFSGLIFGLAHIVSRVSQHGLDYPGHDAMLGLQTFLGGLLLGYIYLRAKSIVPGTILHVAMNAYIGQLTDMLNR